MFCPWCGKAIRDDSTFCPYCGKSVGIPEDTDSQQQDGEEPLDEERMFGAPNPEDYLGAMAGVPSSADSTTMRAPMAAPPAPPASVPNDGYVYNPSAGPSQGTGPDRKKDNRLVAIGVAAAVVIIAVVAAFALGLVGGGEKGTKDRIDADPDAVLKDDVVVFDPEASPFEIVESDEDSVTFSDDPGLEPGNVLAVGITDQTPEGLLRKVESVEQTDSGWKVTTTPAAITDAVDSCDVRLNVVPAKDGSYLISDASEEAESTSAESPASPQAESPATDEGSADEASTSAAAKPNTLTIESDDLLFEEDLVTGEGDDEVAVGTVSASSTGNVELHVADDKVTFRMTDSPIVDFNLDPDEDAPDQIEIDQTLFDEDMDPIEIDVNGMPIVIDQSILATCQTTSDAPGVQPQLAYTTQRTVGFEYSTDDGLTPIVDDEANDPEFSYEGDGGEMTLQMDSGVDITYDVKLNGEPLANMATGVDASLDADLADVETYGTTDGTTIQVDGIDGDLKGTANANVTAPVSGSVTTQTLTDTFGSATGTDPAAEATELYDDDDVVTLCDWSVASTDKPPYELMYEAIPRGKSFVFKDYAGSSPDLYGELVLNGDGTFEGMQDVDGSLSYQSDDNGVNVSDFSGSFSDVTQIDEHTYSMTVADVTYVNVDEDGATQDGQGNSVMEEGDTLYVFLPGSDLGDADVDASFASFASKDPDSCYIYNATQHTGWCYFNQ